jgi:hypothetical protein
MLMSRKALLPIFFAALLFTTAGQTRNASSNHSKASSQSSQKPATQPPKPATVLKLARAATVSIDGLNNGTAQIEFVAPETGVYSVRCEDFKSSVTHQTLNAGVTFLDPPALATAYPPAKQLAKDQHWTLKVDVSNFLEGVEAKANLVDNAGNQLGELTAVRAQVPFGVKLEAASPDNPALSITRGQNPTLTLRNDDPYAYPVHYQFAIDGLKPVEGDLQLPPNGSKSFEFKPTDGWITDWFTSIFKSVDRPGFLVLSYDSTNLSQKTYLPSKTVPVTFHLNYWSHWVPDVAGPLLLFIVLTLGGLTSLLVSCGIPNKLRQVQLRDQLGSLARRISAVSPSVDSRLRVLLRLELKKLEDLLRTKGGWRGPFTRDRLLLVPEWALPDFADTLADAAVGISKLETRVDLAEQLDSLRHTMESVADELPPTVIGQVSSNLQETADRARKPQLTDEEIALTKSLLEKAKTLMSDWAKDTSFATGISARLKRLQGLLGIGTTDPSALKDTDVGKRFQTSMPGAFELLANQSLSDPANIGPDDYKDLDTTTAKLEVAVEYMRFFQSLPASSQIGLDKREESLRAALNPDSWRSLRCAETYVREIKSGVYPEDLRTELLAANGNNGASGVSIELERQLVRQAEPLELCVQFHNRALRRVPALDEWTPFWTFKTLNGPELREKWWTVWHYFDNPGDHEINVYFEGADGKSISDDKGAPLVVSKTIQVLPQRGSNTRERLRAEILKLGIALGVALIALLGGAQEKLASLSLVQGLLAVFVMGFSANVVKDLITQNPQPGKQTS